MEPITVFGILGIIFLLAFVVEALVEAIFGTMFDKVPVLTPYKWALMYVAMIVGVIGAFVYGFDLIFLLASYLGKEVVQLFPAPTTFGIIITGISIGRGSNFVHDVVTKFFKKPELPAG